VSSKSSRFPDAQTSPRTTADTARAIQAIQSATTMTVPILSALPAAGRPGQLLALEDGTLHFWDVSAGAWKAVTLT
jgi:hypothetical protein